MISFGVLFLFGGEHGHADDRELPRTTASQLQMNFVTTISHELRTPLTVISSAADNISHGVVEGKQQLTHYGSVIGSHARQLSALVEQILQFAAAREGQQRYNPRLLKVSEIIEAAMAAHGWIDSPQQGLRSSRTLNRVCRRSWEIFRHCLNACRT